MSVITIIGAGMMGSAMAVPASDNGHEVRLVGTPLDREIITRAKQDGYHITLKRQLPEGVKCYQIEELDEAMKDCDLLIGGISSFGVEWFSDNVLPNIPKSLPVLSVTKGLHANEDGSIVSFPDYIASKAGCDNLSLNAVGGPCISFELADRHDTVVAFCGKSMEDLKKIKSLLTTEYYHINLTTDVIGIETAVAMKNAYALGVSLAIGITESKNGEGCEEEYNQQAGLFAQSTREMYRLIRMLGGNSEEILFGAGDLYVTVFGGRTRRIGTLLGRGKTFKEAREILEGVTLESVAVTQEVIGALKQRKADMSQFPLLNHIYEMIENGATVCVPWKNFEEEC